MKKRRFHRHTRHQLQWLESYSLFFSTQLFSPSLSFLFSYAITAEIKMGRKLRKTTTDAVAEILVVPCSRGGLWRGEETRGMRREIEPVV
ncbi:hypothetical protein HID58_058454 [Brassica napus]|uniref:Uncharacterized protein n=1 Tax=Brassica napus TaxID=3708 RepID=A0ABQ7ZQF4_BRANA|nr:hypothetical protein HID58_058454 [Brassica napus]